MLRARSGGGEGRQPHDWARTTGLVTALTAVGALVFTGLSRQATRRQVAIGEQAQLGDRFLRAVEQLADQGEGRTRDLSRMSLAGADLTGADLGYADLSGVVRRGEPVGGRPERCQAQRLDRRLHRRQGRGHQGGLVVNPDLSTSITSVLTKINP